MELPPAQANDPGSFVQLLPKVSMSASYMTETNRRLSLSNMDECLTLPEDAQIGVARPAECFQVGFGCRS